MIHTMLVSKRVLVYPYYIPNTTIMLGRTNPIHKTQNIRHKTKRPPQIQNRARSKKLTKMIKSGSETAAEQRGKRTWWSAEKMSVVRSNCSCHAPLLQRKSTSCHRLTPKREGDCTTDDDSTKKIDWYQDDERPIMMFATRIVATKIWPRGWWRGWR